MRVNSEMSRQIKRKEFKQIIELPAINIIPVRFTFTQYLQPMELFIVDSGDYLEKPFTLSIAQCR